MWRTKLCLVRWRFHTMFSNSTIRLNAANKSLAYGNPFIKTKNVLPYAWIPVDNVDGSDTWRLHNWLLFPDFYSASVNIFRLSYIWMNNWLKTEQQENHILMQICEGKVLMEVGDKRKKNISRQSFMRNHREQTFQFSDFSLICRWRQ